jgi:hypothetical protein
MPLIYDLSIGKNHMLSVSIILNKKMLHFYEQSWQNQIERILPKLGANPVKMQDF